MVPYILFADDDPNYSYLFKKEVERRVVYSDVVLVDDGPELLSYLANCNWDKLPSVILMNHVPGVMAETVLKELSVDPRYSAIRVVLWSDEELAKEQEAYRQLGVSDFFTKPDNAQGMTSVIRQIADMIDAELSRQWPADPGSVAGRR